MQFDKAYFDAHSGDSPEEKPPETRSFMPLRLELPKSTAYEIIHIGPKGGATYNLPQTVDYLMSQLILFYRETWYKFDGRIYNTISTQDIKDMINDACSQSGIPLYPTEYEVKNTLSVARSVLRVQSALRPFEDAETEYKYTVEEGGQLVPFENGILNTTTMELLPFTPHLFVTGYIHTEYRPEITDNPQTDSILKGIIPTQETLDFFYEMIGYILFERDMYPPALFNIYGPGKTGKSTLAETIAAILGKENIAKMGIGQLTAQFSTAELDGKQLNICGETGGASAKETRFDGELIKRLSEGDEVMVEKKHKDPFYIKNMAKFLFVTNSIPDFGDASSGLYRRLYVIPCRVEQTEPDLKRKLATPESKSWILNKALAAYNMFVKNGKVLTISPQMKLELTQYMTQDSVLDFLLATFNTSDRYQLAHRIAEDEEFCYSTNLYEAYVEYTRHALSQPLSRKKFVERIRNEYSLKTKTVPWVVNDRTTTRTKYVL